MEYETYFKNELWMIEQALREALKCRQARPQSIHTAMQYAVFTGGKRFRPVLTLAACKACGGIPKQALPAACAIELIHTYSLIHDDLPALDNDDMRRGKPTCHKKFSEAIAILAGDGLLTMAFELLSEFKPASGLAVLLREVSTAAGVHGMIGGQVEDIETTGKTLSLSKHDLICARKTGALIRASAVAGALSAGASKQKAALIAKFGENLGLAFQVVDDLLDRDGYCRFLSKQKTVEKVKRVILQSRREAQKLGKNAVDLIYLTDFLEARIP